MREGIADVSSTEGATAAKHPRGLYTLFFTEMWERFSYYGMRALLVLFMVDAVKHGGLGLTDETATAIYGLYTAAVYLAALPGGWVADRFLGAQRSVWYGGIVIACGHFTLAIPGTETFYLGLLLVVLVGRTKSAWENTRDEVVSSWFGAIAAVPDGRLWLDLGSRVGP